MTHRAVLWLLPFLLLCVPAHAQGGEGKAIAAFKKGFKPDGKVLEKIIGPVTGLRDDQQPYVGANLKRTEVANGWKEAVQHLQGFGSERVAKLIASSWAKVDKQTKSLWEAHDKDKKRVEKDYKRVQKITGGKYVRNKDMTSKHRSALSTFLQASAKVSETRRNITFLTTLQEDLRQLVAKLPGTDGLRWMLQNVVGDKKLPLALKVAAIQRATDYNSELLPDMVAALDKAKAADELAALVFGLGLLKEQAKASTPKLIELLQHADSGVREQAALALQHMKAPASIKPMIDLLARERGHAQKRIAAALEILTSQQHGINIGAWQRWFANEGGPYAEGKVELGKGKVSAHEAFNKKNYYYGIRQDGKAIVYVIDCSGSMVVDAKNPKWGDPERQRDPLPASKGKSRSEASKKELVKAIDNLTGQQRFNVIWYNHEAQLYKKKLIDATPGAKKAAQKFVRGLPADSSTNIYEAMKVAFTLTGRGGFDKAYGVEFDTIFLLTDGKPTLQGSGDDDPMKIIEGVRKWNSLKRVTIHTIAMGEQGIDHKFLKQLAHENGGESRKIIDGKAIVDKKDKPKR